MVSAPYAALAKNNESLKITTFHDTFRRKQISDTRKRDEKNRTRF
jgi:hypothetical protein